MKPLAAAILLSIYLFGATEACQLLKLPFLVNHFIEHNSNDKTAISFIQFLKLHYSDQTANIDTDHQHHKLPFKSVDICCIVGHTVITTSEISLQLPARNFITIPYASYQPGDYFPSHTGDIFQPPKA